MKLNIACGRQTWPGFFCVDAVPDPRASRPLDMVHEFVFDGATLTNPVPLADGCASELHNYHFLEHVYRWQAPALVAEFHRLLKHGGKLVMELPDIEKCARNLLAGQNDQLCMWGLYGDPGPQSTYMCHRWGYTPATVADLLLAAGFRNITTGLPQTHGRRNNRDMRVEALK